MNSLTKQFKLILLSCILLISCEKSYAKYESPLIPVFSKGDDLSRALVKPDPLYEEVNESKIEIPNMPVYKTQDELGECRAFSLATILQKYTCDRFEFDCRNLPEDSSISYSGMLIHTNQKIGEKNSLEPNQEKANGMYDVIQNLSYGGNKLILDSCKPFDKLVNNFSKNGKAGLQARDKFFIYLKELYSKRTKKTEADIVDCPECLEEINKNIGLNTGLTDLRKALTSSTFESFLYSLFFASCKLEAFPKGFSVVGYPTDEIIAKPSDLKEKIILGLKQGKPVLYPSLCLVGGVGESCKLGHSLVVAGYKKVCLPGNSSVCKDVFKVHNSWGEEWQKINNNGWLDADELTEHVAKVEVDGKYRVASDSVMWLNY